MGTAQMAGYYGAWISERNDMFLIYDTTYTSFTKSIADMHDLQWRMNIDIKEDTLRFWKDIKGLDTIHQYDFRIVEKSEERLKLFPISKLSQNAFGLHYTTFSKQPLIDGPFNFEKIVFTDSCRGHYNPCQRSFLEITNEKEIQLTKIYEDWGEDAGKTSYYKDQLEDSTYNRLLYLLENAGFNRYSYDQKRHRFNLLHMNSRSTKSYILTYDHKELAFSTPLSPPTLFELNWLFYQLCHEYQWQEVDSLTLKKSDN